VLAVTSLDPSLPVGIHDGSSRAAKNIVTIANQASQHAQTTYQTATNAVHGAEGVAHNVGAGLHSAAQTAQAGVRAFGSGLQQAGQFLVGDSSNAPAASQVASNTLQSGTTSQFQGKVAESAPRRIIGAAPA
jgi:hypothetical protein